MKREEYQDFAQDEWKLWSDSEPHEQSFKKSYMEAVKAINASVVLKLPNVMI